MDTTFYIPESASADNEPQTYLVCNADGYVGAIYADDITFCAVWRHFYEQL
jgi:hypothetical protein